MTISLVDMPPWVHFVGPALAAGVLAAPMRLRILAALLRAEASVSELAARLDADWSSLSYHLAMLRRHALIHPVRHGRLIVYRVEPRRIRVVLTALRQLQVKHFPRTPALRSRARRLPTRGNLRQARACYDHLGGLAGVYLLEELIRRRWLVRRQVNSRSTYSLTSRGAQALMRRRVNLLWAGRRRRKFAYGCPDWSPGRLHLGGALGAALLESLIRTSIVQPEGFARRMTVPGPLAAWLDGGVGRASSLK